MWNKIKYYLGMRCIVQFRGKYAISKHTYYDGRVFLDKETGFWWNANSRWINDCLFDTVKDAENYLDYMKVKSV